MKIDAPLVNAWMTSSGPMAGLIENRPCYKARLVRESDWRKIMAVVRAAEEIEKCNDGPILMSRVDIEGEARDALDALRKHLAKK